MEVDDLDLSESLDLERWLRSEAVAEFQQTIEAKMVEFLFNSNLEEPYFLRAVQMLAWIGSRDETRVSLQREVVELSKMDESLFIHCGLCKELWKGSCKTARFVYDHKVEILVGAALAATAVGVAVATGYTCSVAVSGVVIAGAGSIFTSEEPHKSFIPNIAPPSSKQEIAIASQSPFSSLPKLELPSSDMEFLVTAEGIWANGQFFSNEQLMKRSLFSDELSKLAPFKPEVFAERLAAQSFEEGSNTLSFESIAQEPKLNIPAPICEAQPNRSKPFTIEGKLTDMGHISWINGICNSLDESQESARYIQSLSDGFAVSGIYNCTHGAVADVLESGLNHLGYSPNTADLLRNEWQNFHETNKSRPNARLLQVCHSQGAIAVKNALLSTSPEVRDRVIVIAVAPAAVVPDRLCFKSFNYASEKDFVYKLEPSPGRPVTSLTLDDVLIPTFGEATDDRGELVILEPHPEATGIDHAFQSPTYVRELQRVIENYKEHKGEYLSEEKRDLK